MSFKCCCKNSKEQKDVDKAYLFLRTIADKNRLKIICVLREKPRCVCEIFSKINISQKLASHHLSQLKKAGLVSEKREGNFIRHSLNQKNINDYKKIINKII
jgi:ArsR family transcriptional regulator, arsenate/arsenite/antimonite-responsive transcriptional repressor